MLVKAAGGDLGARPLTAVPNSWDPLMGTDEQDQIQCPQFGNLVNRKFAVFKSWAASC